jgi:hypothetical protein
MVALRATGADSYRELAEVRDTQNSDFLTYSDSVLW